MSAKIIYIHGSAPRRAAEVLKLAGQLTMVTPRGTVAPISRYLKVSLNSWISARYFGN